ncbi:GTP-binding protein EngB required for normal cell division [Nonomuraea muscovyensis]|uniref:GTP-binding protein EngB required for normal cell division n=1 Tax=Nonomuraea muscovyensis TaxID=1124761 RepID=A0A7X0C0T3_9ACTN|nr:GTPase [Nonomuraea muscovyensis]MBB6345345.1 GTP-binding protein EngB required for normal cell division [Nonomuraea muscovyensis]
MKLLRRKEGPSLDSRLEALAEAATLAEGRLPGEAVAGARAVAERAGARRSLSVEHTVAALAGATGSGKSSLFNALAGADVAAVGVTRPTTSAAQAVVWDGPDKDGPDKDGTDKDGTDFDTDKDGANKGSADTDDGTGRGAGPLLDWLDVFGRHPAADASPDFSGLILLDLPDHDSIQLAHRLEVDRLVELVDLLVWVLDPQKYADAALHERYLRPLAAHRDVMVVVLNQVDRLPPAAVDRCLRDLRRLLGEDGLHDVPVLATSARTGTGLDDVRSLLAGRVSDRRSWSARLSADVTTAADLLATASTRSGGLAGMAGDHGHLGAGASAAARNPSRASRAQGAETPVLEAGREAVRAAELPEAGAGDVAARLGRRLTVALEQAAGVPLVLEAVAKGHRHRAVVATGWPVTRWVRRLRPDPLRRLRIGAAPLPAGGVRGGPVTSGDDGQVVGRTSVPAASAVQQAQVDTAIRDVGDAAASGLPGPWAAAVRQAARARSRELADTVDRTVGVTSSRATRRPRWWKAVGGLQWLIFAAMVAGAVWLGALFGLDYLQLPEPPVPTLGEVPWPTVLLVGGALAGVVVALLARLAAWVGGRRRARRTARALRAAIGEVGAAYVLQPVEAELDRYARFRAAVERARA